MFCVERVIKLNKIDFVSIYVIAYLMVEIIVCLFVNVSRKSFD